MPVARVNALTPQSPWSSFLGCGLRTKKCSPVGCELFGNEIVIRFVIKKL